LSETKLIYSDENVSVRRSERVSGRFSMIDQMYVERGSKADWEALHDFHYKSESLPIAPSYWRCVTAEGKLVGVVVLSTVSLLLRARHDIFPKLRNGHDSHYVNVERARFLNRNFRRAARIVTDNLFRGVGVSYRMVNLAMRMEQFKYVEIISSMAKFNPFDVKAGFKHGKVNPPKSYDKGLVLFRKWFDAHPADYASVMEEYNAMPLKLQEVVDGEVKRFYYKNSAKEQTGQNLRKGSGSVDAKPFGEIVRELQQLTFATPAYGIWINPDLNTTLPDRLPLSAFDLQGVNEPLRLDKL
jgi:ABC-type ATPase with predicted acetyltransferase domain